MNIKLVHLGIMHNEHGVIIWLGSLAATIIMTVLFLVWKEAHDYEPQTDNSLSQFELYYERLESEDRMVAMFARYAKERQAQLVARIQKDFGHLMTIALFKLAERPIYRQGEQLRLI